MHTSASAFRKHRRRVWFFATLIAIVISWLVIQAVQAASIYIVDPYGRQRSSVALVGSAPVISYYDQTNQDLMLAICGDAACTTFSNTLRRLDATGNVGNPSAVVVIDDKPVIAYLDFTNSDLKVAACSDSTCTAPPTITVVDNTVISNAAQLSMTVVNGNPAISYQDVGYDLSVAICVDPACSTPATIRPLDVSTANTVASLSSINVVGGNPIVSYVDATNKTLKVAACVDSTCSSPATITTVTSLGTTGTLGGESSMIIVNGTPLIAYEPSYGTDPNLKVAACVDPACASPAVINTVMSGADPNGISAALINGVPVIAFGTVPLNPALRLATCNDLTCSSSTITTLTGALDAGIYPSMVNLNNYPAISYYDTKNLQLRFYYGGDEGNGLTITPTPSPTITPSLTRTPTPTPYATPAQVGTLVPLAPAASDAYGSAVAVSGDTVVVGAPFRDHDGLTDAGTVFVYKWNGTIWAYQAELIPADASAADEFGRSIGIYGDTIVVGAAGDDDGGSAAGSAYIFVRDGSTWSQQAKLISPDPNADDGFGNAVSISVDTVLIGASGDDQAAGGAGAAYVFARGGTVWSLQQKLMAGDPVANSQFGYAVDLYAHTAVIGAPRPDTLKGAAYVFVRPWHTTSWTQQQKLLPDSYVGVGDHFGASVAVYNETIVVGVPEAEGSVAANPDDGLINVFNRTGTIWTVDSSYSWAIPTVQPSTEPQRSGAAVDVYRETFLAGVPGRKVGGAHFPGGAYAIADLELGIWGRWLMATPSGNHALLGASVARDGNTVVVGAPGEDFFGTDAGAAYIFRILAPPWQPTASVTPSLTPTLTPSATFTPTATYTPTATNTPYTPTSPPNSTPGPHFFAVRHPTLTWNWISWATGYRIQIDDDPNFGSPIAVPPEFSAVTLSYMVESELADGIYYWRAQAKKNATEWGNWSATQTIVVSAP